jgi:hypothetical protein
MSAARHLAAPPETRDDDPLIRSLTGAAARSVAPRS